MDRFTFVNPRSLENSFLFIETKSSSRSDVEKLLETGKRVKKIVKAKNVIIIGGVEIHFMGIDRVKSMPLGTTLEDFLKELEK